MPFAGDLIQIAAIKVGPIKSDPELGVLISAFGNHLKLSGQTGSCKSTDAFFAQDSPTTRCLLVLLLEGCGGFQPCIPDCLKGHSDTVVFYLGVGWDAGYHSRAELKEMWAALGPDVLARLEEAAGKKGRAAQALIPKLRVIEIPRSVSIQVLRRSLNEHYYPFVLQLFPGLERLPAEVQVVFISVVFNRGASMGGDPDWRTAKEVDRRWEMRRLRADVEDADMFAIYAHLGTMKRLWETSGPRGIPLRRRDEQVLIRPYLNQQLRWDENREMLKKEGLPPCPD